MHNLYLKVYFCIIVYYFMLSNTYFQKLTTKYLNGPKSENLEQKSEITEVSFVAYIMSLILIMLLTLIFYIFLFSLFWKFGPSTRLSWLLDNKDVVYSLSQVFLFLITEQATLKTGYSV